MCGITGSFDKGFILEGMKYCRDRGNSAYSFTEVSPTGTIVAVTRVCKRSTRADVESLISRVGAGSYMLLHQQAPTTRSTPVISSVHPAVTLDRHMWHNGILIKYEGSWDTKYLLKAYMNNKVGEVQGSFACVLADASQAITSWYVFRNMLCPLYVDRTNMNVCSMKIESGLEILPKNDVHMLDWDATTIVHTAFIEESNDIYYIPEENA